jgi:hypothetical protein
MIWNFQNEKGAFSADVALRFHFNGNAIELGQLGPGFAILREAQKTDATEGEIESIVDNKTTRYKVRITSPITEASKRFTFEVA